MSKRLPKRLGKRVSSFDACHHHGLVGFGVCSLGAIVLGWSLLLNFFPLESKADLGLLLAGPGPL